MCATTPYCISKKRSWSFSRALWFLEYIFRDPTKNPQKKKHNKFSVFVCRHKDAIFVALNKQLKQKCTRTQLKRQIRKKHTRTKTTLEMEIVNARRDKGSRLSIFYEE